MLLLRLKGAAKSAAKRGGGKLGKANFMLASLAVKDKGLWNIVGGRAYIPRLLRVGQIFSGNGCDCGIVGIKDADDAGDTDIFLVSDMEIHEKRSFLFYSVKQPPLTSICLAPLIRSGSQEVMMICFPEIFSQR